MTCNGTDRNRQRLPLKALTMILKTNIKLIHVSNKEKYLMLLNKDDTEIFIAHVGKFTKDTPPDSTSVELTKDKLLQLAIDIATVLGYEVKIEGKTDARKEVQDTPQVRNKDHHHARRQDAALAKPQSGS